MSSVAEQLNLMPIYAKAKAIHDNELLPAHRDRVKKFLESGDPNHLYPSAPGSEKKLKSNFGNLSHTDLQSQPSVFMTVIEGPLTDSGGVAGRVAGDLPLRLAALALAKREMRLATAQECALWIAEGEQRRKDAQEAAKRKADIQAGRDAELAALREKADLLERIQKAETNIERTKAGAQ